jgi:hypothetical protein
MPVLYEEFFHIGKTSTQNRDFSEQPVHISIGNNNKLFVKPLIIYITTG